jgi:hypothetical protein
MLTVTYKPCMLSVIMLSVIMMSVMAPSGLIGVSFGCVLMSTRNY